MYPYDIDYTPEHHKGPGAWTNEPNFADWTAHGLPVAITRHMKYGHLCGYVGLPKTHPYYDVGIGTTFMELSTKPTSSYLKGVGYIAETNEPVLQATAHYGLDYAKGFGDLWWLGFACNHCDDLEPRNAHLIDRLDRALNAHKVYRTWVDVTIMVNTLARDLAQIRGLRAA